MSLGGGQYFSACDASQSSRKAAIDNLRSVNIATVISSGNSGYKTAIGAPACISTAISVGSTTDSDVVSSFSNVASFLSLLAPGSSINSSVPGGGYDVFNGTSMAAPHVTGAWAILKSKFPSASVDEILKALQITGVLVNDTRSGGTVTGMRRIQVDYALNAMYILYLPMVVKD
jgi:subtilisin family serine protease